MKYDFERLDKYCKENNVILLEDYSGCNLKKDKCIKGNCIYENCKNIFEKKFENLTKTGAYCKNCIKLMLVKRAKTTFLEKYGSENILQLDFVKEKTNPNKFNNEKLIEYCKEHNIQLLEDYSNIHITKKSSFKAKCQSDNCNEVVEKIFREIEKTGIYCKECMNKIKREKTVKTCLEKYGVANSSQSKVVQQKYKETCIEKYGVEHAFQSNNIKDKIKATMLEKYGVENATQNEDIKNKIKETNLKKYGCSNTLHSETIKAKVKTSMIQKYGVEYASQNKDIKNKKKETCLKNWGVNMPSQNSEIMEKILKKSYSKKEYMFPSGKVENIQGYENFALDELIIAEKIDESDIIIGVKNVPEIWYNDKNNVKRRYYVDIYIPSQNKCIEVKSSYTYKKNEQINILKQEAAKNLGYDFEFWIYDSKGNRINICDNKFFNKEYNENYL